MNNFPQFPYQWPVYNHPIPGSCFHNMDGFNEAMFTNMGSIDPSTFGSFALPPPGHAAVGGTGTLNSVPNSASSGVQNNSQHFPTTTGAPYNRDSISHKKVAHKADPIEPKEANRHGNSVLDLDSGDEIPAATTSETEEMREKIEDFERKLMEYVQEKKNAVQQMERMEGRIANLERQNIQSQMDTAVNFHKAREYSTILFQGLKNSGDRYTFLEEEVKKLKEQLAGETVDGE